MFQLIIGIIVFLFAIAILKKLIAFAGNLFVLVLGLIGGVIFGTQGGLAYLTYKITNENKSSDKTSLVMFYIATLVSAFILYAATNNLNSYWYHYYNGVSFSSIKSIGVSLLIYYSYKSISKINDLLSKSERDDFDFLIKKQKTIIISTYFSFFMFLSMLVFPFLKLEYIDRDYIWWFDLTFWLVAVISAYVAIATTKDCISMVNKINEAINKEEKIIINKFIEHLKEDKLIFDDDDVTVLVNDVVGINLLSGHLTEVDLPSGSIVFRSDFYINKINEVKNAISLINRADNKLLRAITKQKFDLLEGDLDSFIEKYIDFGGEFRFKDGRFFVTNINKQKFRFCASCGVAESVDNSSNEEWYCSSICKETNQNCISIKNKDISEFISDASTSGFILMKGAEAWNNNHKMVATGSQGHGFAAENANNMIDRIKGNNAKVIGGDNLKNGADRLVNGHEIQTKYCSTAARSVGAGFDGQTGNYKYIDSAGNPMQLEVPKDQYELAVKTMAKKIQEGKVVGVTDPEEAKKLIKAGAITYDQAKNITKFGTLESISYDVAEGVVVSVASGGISFCISALVYYVNTGDKSKSLQIAAIQAGKTFGKTLTIYVSTQQLHRLTYVQNALSKIDIANVSPTLKNFLKKGFNVESTEGVNKALRGTIVTSIALIAITTGPDMIKLARGRISKAQFIKNLSVTSSSVAGGAIGSVAGGALGSPLGPVGMIVGRIAGGIVGGIIASSIANAIANELMVEDKVKMLEIIQEQIQYLAINFMLSQSEIESLNDNLGHVITNDTLEVLYQRPEERYQLANYYIQPVVVSIIKQRPQLTFTDRDVVDACVNLCES